MDDSDLRRQLSEAQETICALQEELEETNKGLIALNIELEQREERFRSIFESAQEGIITSADDGRILSANPAAAEILGYEGPEDLVDRSAPEIWVDLEQKQEIIEQSLQRGYARNVEITLRKKDGTCCRVLGSATLHKDQTGNVLRIESIFTDITEHKKTEERLDRQTRELEHSYGELAILNKELEAFSYSVSHDLRAPLRSIDGFSQALLEDYYDILDSQGQDYLHRVRAATRRMAELIDDLLSLSRVTRSEMRRKRIDLGAMAHAIIVDLRKTQPERKVAFVIGEGIIANGDSRLLKVALENLLGNAWKFTGKQASAKIELGVMPQDGKEVFFVRDNGAGFDMSYAGKLFGAFQRLHSEKEFPGTGIGLATVQRIVHRHGGDIWAEGEVGRGATFYFTL